jgi:hypothetical protein
VIKTIELFMKHNDMANFEATDENGKKVFAHDGYMPYTENLGGDDTELTIDNATGKIIGWVPITLEEIKAKNEDLFEEEEVE